MSAEKPVRYGVISAGRMACYTMTELMRNHPAAEPVAWYELDPVRADTAERLPSLRRLGLAECDSLESLLAREDVDVILNVTPHYAHAETSIAALRAGRTVICEKPPACSRQEIGDMVAASRSAGDRLMVHFQHVLRPATRWLGEAIRAGRLGRIRRVRCQTLWWREPSYYGRVPWAGRREFQGRPVLDGALTNQTIHFLNQMLVLAQRSGEGHVAPVADLRAALYRFHSASYLEMEDTAVAVGTLANDDRTEFVFAGTVCASGSGGQDRLSEYAGIPETHQILIEGERGRAMWDGSARLEIDGEAPEVFDRPDGSWPFYFHVRDVLAGRAGRITPIEQAAHTMDFIFRTYESANGQAIFDRPWEHHPTVADTLRQCVEQLKLPAELDRPPTWA